MTSIHREDLIAETLARKLGRLTSNGALAVDTGKYTGRAANNRFIVKHPAISADIDWGKVNQAMEVSEGAQFFDLVEKRLETLTKFKHEGFVAGLKVETCSSSPWHILFAENMFRSQPVPSLGGLETFKNKALKIFHLPDLCPADLGFNYKQMDALIVLDPLLCKVAIVGTAYAGEIKKAAFTMANYLLPAAGILPMHASANCLADGTQASVLFGLSGTGKTTLSMIEGRALIGDDEIAWNPHSGLSNLEGGCYAKLIDLDPSKEPQIYRAIAQPSAILENVVLDAAGNVLFSDRSKSENTRGSFGIKDFSKLSEVFDQSKDSAAPLSIVFLMADAFGAMPAVAKLNFEQAQYHFMSGYTAKVAGTEVGVREPQAAFSACFGAPFMPRPPAVYAKLLAQTAQKNKANVYLLNTGWTGGSYSSGAKRFPIPVTRKILEAIQSGELAKASFTPHPVFGFEVPKDVPGVEKKFLDSPSGRAVEDLADKFKSNIHKFKNLESAKDLSAGGPF